MPDRCPLPRGGVRTLLTQLEQPESLGIEPAPSGGIHLTNTTQAEETGPEAVIWLQAGFIYSATLSTFKPLLARRLRSTGAIDDTALPRLADLKPEQVADYAVNHLHVSRALMDALHRELLLSTATHLFDWVDAQWWWQPKENTTSYTTTPMPASLVASASDERIGQWGAVARNYPYVTMPTSVPKAGPGWAAKAGGEVTPELAAMLTHVDGKRTIGQIATSCGFTRFEITRLLASATADKILVFPDAKQPDNGADLHDALLAEEIRQLGHVSTKELEQAEEEVAQARLALQAAETKLATIRQAIQARR